MPLTVTETFYKQCRCDAVQRTGMFVETTPEPGGDVKVRMWLTEIFTCEKCLREWKSTPPTEPA